MRRQQSWYSDSASCLPLTAYYFKRSELNPLAIGRCELPVLGTVRRQLLEAPGATHDAGGAVFTHAQQQVADLVRNRTAQQFGIVDSALLRDRTHLLVKDRRHLA